MDQAAGRTPPEIRCSIHIFIRANPIEVTLKHIPAGQYDIYLYGARGAVGSVNGNYTITIGSLTNAGLTTTLGANWAAEVATNTWVQNEHYALQSGLSVSTGQNIIIRAYSGSGVAIINGLQLVASGSVNTPPNISQVPSQLILRGGSTGPLNFTVSDNETPAGNLFLSVSSDNPGIIPNSNIVLGGSGANRTVTVTPVSNLTGGANITVTVSDGINPTSMNFHVGVLQPGSGPGALVYGVYPGGIIRSNYDGWVGFKFTVGSSPITVTDLGRWVLSGNNGSHTVQLFDSQGNAMVNASATVTTAGKPAGQFTYAALASPITLTNGQTYAVMSLETGTGDKWLDYANTTVLLDAVASHAFATYRLGSPPMYDVAAEMSYVPTDLKYTLTVKLPISGFNVAFNSDHSVATVSAGSQSGATVYYTTNGTDPTQSSSTNSPQISSGATVVKARAFRSGYTASDVITLPSIGVTASVGFSPNGHSPTEYSNGPLAVQMSSESGATVFYKVGTGGSWLSTSSGGSPSIDGIDNGNGAIQAYAFTANKFRSATATSAEYSFRLPQPASAVSYNSSFTTGTLTFSDAVGGATIRYTSDGSVPTTASTIYGSPLSATTPTKYYARAYKAGYVPSGHISAWVNQLPAPRIATSSGLLTGNITVNNPVDVWLLPNFGFENVYGENHSTTGWTMYEPTWNSDVPNANFPGSFAGSTTSSWAESVPGLSVSYGRTYTLSGWFRKQAAGGIDFAGLSNYADDGTFICADDINEPGSGVTWLTQALVDGAASAQVANGQVFSSLAPEWYFDLFVPLSNFSRTVQMQHANQPNNLNGIYQFVNLDANFAMKVTAVNGNALSFTIPYHGPTLPIGTVVGRRDAGGWYQYQLLSGNDISTAWTRYWATTAYLRAGTETVHLLALLYSGSTRFTGYEFWEGTAAQRPNLYYTLNGSSSVYTQTPVAGPVKMTLDGNSQGIINLGQRGANYIDSPVLQRTITFKAAAPQVTPTLNPSTGQTAYAASSATTGAEIRYTTDGSEPTAASSLYNPASPPTLAGSLTTKWKAFKANYTQSDTDTVLGVPAFSPPGGTFSSAQSVTITAPAGAQLKVFQPNASLLNIKTWSVGAMAPAGFYFNGQSGENAIELRESPHNTLENVWVAYNLDSDNNGELYRDGGFHTDPFNVDSTKLYRFSVWVRTIDNSPEATSGVIYFGPGADGGVSTLTGSSADSIDSNPYFWTTSIPLNRWHLIVGYIHPAGYLGTSPDGRLYNLQGQVVSSATDFRWVSTSSSTLLRTYFLSSTEAGIQQEFWNPRVEVVGSVNDPIDVLFVAPTSPTVSSVTVSLDGNVGNQIQSMIYAPSSSSLVSSQIYQFQTPTPTVVPTQDGRLAASTMTNPQLIRFTSNGTDPTEASQQYAGPIIPPGVQTKWKAFKVNYLPSDTLVFNDTDMDGLPDEWEIMYFGSLIAQNGTGDPDNDGISNLWEFALGLNPLLNQNSDTNSRSHYQYDLLNRVTSISGAAQISINADKEGNILQVNP